MSSGDAPRRASRLEAGRPVALTNLEGGRINRLLLGATWDDPTLDLDLCAVLLGADGQVGDRSHFLYRNQRRAPGGVGFVTCAPAGAASSPDRAQVLLDLQALPASVERVLLACSVMRQGGSLAEAGVLKSRVMDLATGQTTYVYVQDLSALAQATCLQLWELRRAGDAWQTMVHGVPHPGGPPAFARDHGVRFG